MKKVTISGATLFTLLYLLASDSQAGACGSGASRAPKFLLSQYLSELAQGSSFKCNPVLDRERASLIHVDRT